MIATADFHILGRHGMIALSADTLLVFGGDAKPFTNTVIIGVITAGSDAIAWRDQAVTGQIPRSRASFLMTIMRGDGDPKDPNSGRGAQVVVYGGLDEKGTCMDDMFVLDTHVWEWRCVYASTGAWLRGKKSTGVLDSGRLLLLCGQRNVYDEIHALDWQSLVDGSSVLAQASQQLASDLTELNEFSAKLLATLNANALDNQNLSEEAKLALLLEVT